MKWLSTKTHRPAINGYYIVRFVSNDCESNDKMFRGYHYDSGLWLYDTELDGFVPTHFIIPDALELED